MQGLFAFGHLLGTASPAQATPYPDPPPQACQDGWCRVPTVMKSTVIGPTHLAGKRGWWYCLLTGKKYVVCWQFG